MSAPRFRSTAALAHHQRASVPTVDRATFVVFSLKGQRYAVPVELVERVLRIDPTADAPADHARFAGRNVKLIDLRLALRPDHASRDGLSTLPIVPDASAARVLIFTLQSVWVAAAVDAVHEVATIDASTVVPIANRSNDPTPQPVPAGVRAQFTRHDHVLLVLDMVRVMRTLFERARAADPTAASEHP